MLRLFIIKMPFKKKTTLCHFEKNYAIKNAIVELCLFSVILVRALLRTSNQDHRASATSLDLSHNAF